MSSNPQKDTAWKYFSKYIRVRDALKTTGTTTHAKCVTCGKIQRIEDMDTGHAIPGRANGILFSEDLCHAQCRDCNRYGGGELKRYRQILIALHGQEKWDEWEAMKHKFVKFTTADYKRLAGEYRQKIRDLIGKEG